MVPVGWTMMECPKTKESQPRKVAKIIQDRKVECWHLRNLGGSETTNGKSGSNKSSSASIPPTQKESSGDDSDIISLSDSE